MKYALLIKIILIGLTLSTLPAYADNNDHLVTPSNKIFEAIEMDVIMNKLYKIANQNSNNIDVTVIITYNTNTIKEPLGKLSVRLWENGRYLAAFQLLPTIDNENGKQPRNLKLPKDQQRVTFNFQINEDVIQESRCSIVYGNYDLELRLKDWKLGTATTLEVARAP